MHLWLSDDCIGEGAQEMYPAQDVAWDRVFQLWDWVDFMEGKRLRGGGDSGIVSYEMHRKGEYIKCSPLQG